MVRRSSKSSRSRNLPTATAADGEAHALVNTKTTSSAVPLFSGDHIVDHNAALQQLGIDPSQLVTFDPMGRAASDSAVAWVRTLLQITRLPFFESWELSFLSGLRTVILEKGSISEIEAKAATSLLRAHGMILRRRDGTEPNFTFDSAASPDEDKVNRANALGAFYSLAERLPWAKIAPVSADTASAGTATSRSSSSPQASVPNSSTTRQADPRVFWDGVATAFGHWATDQLPALLIDMLAGAGSDEAAATRLFDALKHGLTELIDADAAARMRHQLTEQDGPTAFHICNLSDVRIYLLVLEHDYQFVMSAKITQKAMLIEVIRSRLGALDETRLRAIYALASDDSVATGTQAVALGPETVPTAIANFTGRPKGETAPAFIKRVYGTWLQDMSRQDLKRVNEPAYRGLYAYEELVGRRICKDVEGFDLPTRSEMLDRQLAAAGISAPTAKERRRKRRRSAASRNGPS